MVRPIVEGLRNRFSVSAAEVDHNDLWQRAAIGVAAVSGEVRHLEEILEKCERFVDSFPEIEVISVDQKWME